MQLNEIRNKFLQFFGRNNHHIMPSSSLIPHNDPSLLFTNSGMVQFKNVFTGTEKIPYSRATTSQKCVRAGGKHNDLDNVGYTARHHTFFEMLGNFSFGDYFKEEAIRLAWEFVQGELGLDPKNLYFTVYHEDQEAYKLWQKYASADRIIPIATNDNFWMMGDVGPCGPCSEIFYDLGEEVWGGLPGTPEADGDRYIEIWNLVFMQYEALPDGGRNLLPKPSIDTGMGLERVAAVLQGVKNNYDTDLFHVLIEDIASLLKVKVTNENAPSFRVIADHLRSSCFLIADGVLPSNEGRGYVLRRIMRRAMLHANKLNCKEPILFELQASLTKLMGEVYPELYQAASVIKEHLFQEEERFQATLDRGLKLLFAEVENLSKGDILDGKVAFKLYDTYGFPLDLTTDILREKNISVEESEFMSEMAKQKELARKAWSGSGEKNLDELSYQLTNNLGQTEFVGYNQTSVSAKVIALVQNENLVEKVTSSNPFWLIVDKTPFYAESGGQVGDHGSFINDTSVMQVTDTKKLLNKLYIHIGQLTKGEIKIGDQVEGKIDVERRYAIRRSHSATHLLHAALRKYLGQHIMQKGSVVAPDYLRFDVSHPKPITQDEIELIEQKVNEQILANSQAQIQSMNLQEALKTGAIGLFGEKYEAEVRVIHLGEKEAEQTYSAELCGGTHVQNTGEIGLFKIISEGGIAAGIRRIEALTGYEALKYSQKQAHTLRSVSEFLKTGSEEILNKIQSLVDNNQKLQKELKNLTQQKLATSGSAEKIGNINYIHNILTTDVKSARELTESQISKKQSTISVTLTNHENKVSLIIGISDDLTGKYNAVELIKSTISLIGGVQGGGRVNLAQGGGNDFTKASEVINSIRQYLDE